MKTNDHRLNLAKPVLLLICASLMASCATQTPKNRNNGLVGVMQRKQGHAAPGPVPAATALVSGEKTGTSLVMADQISSSLGESFLHYRTSPGDELTISFFRKPPPPQPDLYILNAGDRISVSVSDQPQYSKDVVIRQDGRFSYYMIGEIFAKGKTLPAVQALLEEKFREVIPAARVTVFLEEGSVLVNGFLETLTSNQMQGSTRPVRVRADGFVNFPLIGEVHMVGMTLPVLSRIIEEKYNEIFVGGMSVTINMVSDVDANVAVIGEVNQPGRFRIWGPTRVSDILVMAGGQTLMANKTAVLIRRTGENEYRQYYVRLDPDARDLMTGYLSAGLVTMNAQDMLIVPKSTVGKLDAWVQKYIQRLFLFRGTSFTVGARIDD